MARKRTRTSYNKEWYNRYRSALRYLGVDIPEVEKPSKRAVQKAKAQWQGIRKEMKSKGWIDLPTVYEASAMVEEKPKIESQYSDYIDTYLTQVISQIESRDYHEIQKYESGKGAVEMLNEAKNNLLDIIASAREKIQDDKLLAQAISKSTFVQRAMDTIEYYTRTSQGTDALTFMDREVTPVLEQAINDVIRNM